MCRLASVMVVQHGFTYHRVGVGLHMDVLGLAGRDCVRVHLRGEPRQCLVESLVGLDLAHLG